MNEPFDIQSYFRGQVFIINDLVNTSKKVRKVGDKMVEWWKEGRIFLGCGNGGSAAEVSHAVGEATIRLRKDDSRPPFLFINLAADSSILTAGANDLGYEEVFAQQVKAAGWHMKKAGVKFVLIGVSTSGTSKNVIRAFEEAKKLEIPTVAITCERGSFDTSTNLGEDKPFTELADYKFIAPIKMAEVNATQTNQVVNLILWHIWFEMIAKVWKEDKEDKAIFSNYNALSSISSLSSSPLATRFQQIVSQFAGKKVLECGDLMLDFTIRGLATGLSPEAAAIKVQARNRDFEFTSGGAANCAKNFSSLGAKTTAWGVIDYEEKDRPDDSISFGHLLTETLKREQIDWIGESDPDRETTVKLRVQANNSHTAMQQLVRVDLEIHDPAPPKNPEKLQGNYNAYHAGDYNKGAVTPELIEILRTQSKLNNAPLVVDPKMGEGRDYLALYSNVTAITPNDKELKEITGQSFDEADDAAVASIGQNYARQINTDIVVTRGEYGCTVCPIQGEVTHIKNLLVENPSVSGVGDTYAAAFTLALACGANLVESAHIAVIASYIAVSKPENASKISDQELLDEITRRQSAKLYPFE